jgi:hypothetical protein
MSKLSNTKVKKSRRNLKMTSGPFNKITVLAALLVCLLILSNVIYATPFGPRNMINLSTTSKTSSGAGPKVRNNDDRGTIITVLMNVSQQTNKWRAYVGNITGKLTLDDALNYTIYDWTVSGVDGEVYSTRSSSVVNWATVTCATVANVETEQVKLSHGQKAADSINRTFTNVTHPSFYAGPTRFLQQQCSKSVNLYQSDVPNTHTWHETLLWDGSNLVYVSILNASRTGYNPNLRHDFQMIVADNGSEGSPNPVPYYFYVEIT